ncbi:MAG: DUF502 domain-containing protein [Gammaproteobacteria bacterium]|nr:DUF502 domain-containing protein [Gammaproteobacteria bacterium]
MTGIRNFLINIFIGGFIVLLPVIIIFQILQWLYSIFEESSRPLNTYLVSEFSIDASLAIMLSLISVVIAFSVIGMIVRTRLGNSLYEVIERMILFRIPGYKTVKELTDQISGKQKGLFRKVALINVGHTGVSATGFVVDEFDEDHSTVFIPCGPNPTTGFILHVKNEDITVVDVPVEKAMKTIIACGSGSSKIFSVSQISAINQK